jgi:hypothetical protein
VLRSPRLELGASPNLLWAEYGVVVDEFGVFKELVGRHDDNDNDNDNERRLALCGKVFEK